MADKPEDIKQEEQDLKEYLEGDSTLSRAYRAEEKAQVPAHLDKAIISAANEAVRSERVSKEAYSPFARSWYVPASMVAVLMLCVGLVFTIYKDSGQTLLTAPKSEYDIDIQISPIESAGKFKQDESGGKNRRAKKSMDETAEANKPVPSSIEGYQLEEPELEKRPASKKIMREEMIEMDDALQPGLSDKNILEKDVARQTRSDLLYNSERRDDPGGREAADVKKQEQLNINVLDNKPGEVELKDNEKETGSARESRYRQTKESLSGKNGLLQEELLKSEVMDDDMTVEGFASPVQPMKDEIMMPEQWLNQIKDLWVSGEHERAKDSLDQFLVTYPDFPIEKLKTILNPETGLMDYIN